MIATRYTRAVMRVLANYPPGSRSLVVALEAIIGTAVERTKEENRDELAETVCQNLHVGPAKGLACGACFDVLETGKMPAEEDMPSPAAATTPAEKAEDDAIQRQVAMLLDQKDDDE